MKGFKVKEKLKKSLIITIIAVMMAFMMPVKSEAGVAGVITDFIDLILMIPDGCMHIIDKWVGGSEEFTSVTLEFTGGYDKNNEVYNFIVTPYDIFSSGSYQEKNGSYYTKLGIFDVNFFADRDIESETVVSSEILAPVIGNVYKALRNLCMVLMMLVILYIGIRIMVSSIAAQQAKYKQLLIDWIVGFALLFIMHYIMSSIVYLNSIVVKMLSNEEGDSYYVGICELEDDVNASQADTDSTWFDVCMGVANDTLDGKKYEKFKSTRLVVRNSKSEDGTFSNVGSSGDNYIGDDGRLDLNAVPRGSQDGDFSTINKGYIWYNQAGSKTDPGRYWGDNGVIYLAASLVNPGHDNDKYSNKAIVRLNTVSYVRTISCYSATGFFSGQPVYLYGNGGKYKADDATSMGFSILYVCIVVETIMFTFVYIKRVLQLAFLTMIAPVVAIMYPVDKIGDGKAQAFNTWFKDYLFNILIQPMHLLLYTVFIVAATQLVSRNIIYALAIYGFMIPAEKYFKKLLGFEKASTGGGGPLGGAIGRGLAMDGLGKLAGIGPGGRHGGKGGAGGGQGRKPKLKKKNKPGDVLPSSSGGPNGSGVGPNGSGEGMPSAGGSRRSTRRGTGRGRPNAGGTPAASGLSGLGKGLGSTVKRRIARGITGGQYDYLNGKNGSKKAAAAYIGKGFGRMVTRGAGTILGGAVGITAGAATAMATGDVQNLWKGAAVGLGAGNKISSNLYDKGAGFIEEFGAELKSERAKIDPEVNKNVRTEDVYRRLDEDLADLSDSDRKKFSEDIDNMAQFVNMDSLKDVKAMHAGSDEITDGSGNRIVRKLDLEDVDDQKEAIAVYNDAHGYQIAGHEKSYLEDTMRTMGVNDETRIKSAVKDYIENGNIGTDAELRKAIERMHRVKAAQKEL